MNDSIDHKRRKILQYAGVGALAATALPSLLRASDKQTGRKASADFHPDVDIDLTARTAHMSLFSGPMTNVWKFEAERIKGPENSVQALPGSYLGPILRFQKGQKIRIRFHNELPAESVVHWHGLHVPSEMDGNPMSAINKGETFVYEFEMLNRAGPYWYHPHPHGMTARQVYSGLAGLIQVTDDEERGLNLPSGEYDVPIVIQDRSFDNKNQLSYSGHMMTKMMGFLGDQIVINGEPGFMLKVATRAYRLRLINGSNSRIYKLAWDDGTPITVIGNDGGLLPRPETRPYLMLGPAERADLWIDFEGRAIGSELVMRSLPFTTGSMGGMGGMGMGGGMGGGRRGGMGRMGRMVGMGGGGMGGGGMGMMNRSALPLGTEYPLLTIRVDRKADSNSELPKQLSSITPYRVSDAANPNQPKAIKLSMRHMSAQLNGRSYKMNDYAADEIMPVNSLQLFELDNGFSRGHGGMGRMMMMAHPMHLHGQQFQIVKRTLNPNYQKAYQTVNDGFVNQGWKDTALVMPGEKVTLLKRFDDFKGPFMYHCHNLEHEDMGMMRDFLIS